MIALCLVGSARSVQAFWFDPPGAVEKFTKKMRPSRPFQICVGHFVLALGADTWGRCVAIATAVQMRLVSESFSLASILTLLCTSLLVGRPFRKWTL